MLPTKFWFIWPSGFRGEDLKKSANQKQELPMVAMFVNGSELNEHLYRGPSKDASQQVSVHLTKRLQRRRFFRNQPIINKNCLWWPCWLTDRDEMSNLIENLPQILPNKFRFIWPSGFRGEDFKKSANQKQELPMVAMFVNGSELNEQSLQRTFHRCFLPSFDSFGQAVSEEKIKKNQPIRNKNCLWWPCLLTDQN